MLEPEDVEAAAGCLVEVIVVVTRADLDAAVAGAYTVMDVPPDVEAMEA